jgi:capsular exopolysaccharide synthesis family protein
MLGTAPVRRKPPAAGDGAGSRLYPVNTAAGDAYRRLQGTLLFSLDRENRSVVLVAGVSNAAPATAVAANLAAMAARAGRRTLIVGADLRNDLLARHLGAETATGLSDVILDGASLADSIQPVEGVDNLSLLSAGTRLDRPADVLQSESFARLMAAVQADYDLVVVEAPPVLRVADAVEVAGLCHASIVVAEGGSETRQAIADSLGQLRGIGSEVVGVVVADAS